MKRMISIELIAPLLILVILALISFIPSVAGNPENPTPKISAIQVDDDVVNMWGDNVTITFQIYDENGVKDIKSVEIWVKNGLDGTERYDNWPEGNIRATENISPYENEYSFTYNPENDFEEGSATIEIRATDNEGHENTERREDLF